MQERAEAVQSERDRCLRIVETEPELPGKMPAEFDLIPVADALRAAVRATKKSIARRIRANSLPDEPVFTLLGRDPEFPTLVTEWAERRQVAINCGERPTSDQAMVNDAIDCAMQAPVWRRENLRKWRKP
jgi:hypothetical protein